MKRLIFILLLLLAPMSVVSAQPILIIVRHAEKATGGGNDPDLSPAGHVRAEMLARILKDAGIKTIFATEFKRTQETAAPTAKSIDVTPTIVAAKDISGLVAKLHELTGNALVVGHGDTIPDLVKALGIATPVSIPDSDYTEMFVVVLGNKPELLRLHYPS